MATLYLEAYILPFIHASFWVAEGQLFVTKSPLMFTPMVHPLPPSTPWFWFRLQHNVAGQARFLTENLRRHCR